MGEEQDHLVLVDPMDHAMVGAALARLGFNGSWDRLLQGGAVTDPLDRADADLLVAARILAPDGAGYRLVRDIPWLQDGRAMAHGAVASLRRALQHAQGRSAGWDGQDADLVLAQGRGSARIAAVLSGWLPEMPSVERAFTAGEGRFLDVGVGVAAISIGRCRRFDGLTCTGLDVVPEVLALGRQEVADAGLDDRIELRQQSVADLDEEAAYDLVWLPQPFIPRPAYVAGVRTLHRAAKPGGWLVTPLMTPPDLDSAFEAAVVVHAAHVLGGGPIAVAEATALLEDAGWVDISRVDAASRCACGPGGRAADVWNHEPPGYDCPFCRLQRGVTNEHNSLDDVVAVTPLAYARISPRWWPANDGAVLVVPRAHHENLYDLPPEVGHGVWDLLQTVAVAMRTSYGCEGVSTRQHNEPSGGQDVWHLHVHLFPRYAGDRLYERQREARAVPPDERKPHADRLAAALGMPRTFG